MSKKILIISTSLRNNSNSSRLITVYKLFLRSTGLLAIKSICATS